MVTAWSGSLLFGNSLGVYGLEVHCAGATVLASGAVRTHWGGYRLAGNSLGVYSLGVYRARATDFGSGPVLTHA